MEPVFSESASDEALIQGYAERADNAAMDVIIRRYSPRLRRLLYTLVGPDVDCINECEQEVFLTLMRKADRFRATSSFSTFFYSLARNRVLDFIRSERRRGLKLVYGRDLDAQTSPDRPPFAGIETRERIDTIRAALETLRPNERLMLYLKDVDGATIDDLSQISGEKSGTIKSRLARARVKMARSLKELCYE
jgi:RNA polymerase sigma-70 factor, ECF subfamily